MLERIEQQTEALNARSERLKMMKLQYEMYFAKLVHSQTKRCIQNSVAPATPMMTSSSAQPIMQNIKSLTQKPVIEEYNYAKIEPPAPLVTNLYQSYTTPDYEKEQLTRTQLEYKPTRTVEVPTLANFVRPESNDCMDLRNLNNTPLIQTPSPYQYLAKYEPISDNVVIPNNNNNSQQKFAMNNISSPITNSSMSLPSVPNNKQPTEVQETPNLSTSISSTFEETSNICMRPQISNNLREIPNTTAVISKNINEANVNDNTLVNENLQPVHKLLTNGTNLTSAKQIIKTSNASLNDIRNNTVNLITQEVGNELKTPVVKHVNDIKSRDVFTPKLMEIPPTSLNPTSAVTKKSINTKLINDQPPIKDSPKTANVSLTSTNTVSNSSSATPVSIENIENAIYGELLSPLETEKEQNPESSKIVPKLMENLVTQSENIETENIGSEQFTIKPESVPNNNLTNDTTDSTSEQNPDVENYEQTMAYDDYNNAQQPDNIANSVVDYNNYENVDSAVIDESQQQQYDYSNYDPTQYTYPGYIYDETTGEYKPDPNAPAEQYATDQQYDTEGYDQQYQQQNEYDYNQMYAQDPTTSTTTVENSGYNNYDTSQHENSSNIVPATEDNAEQQQTATALESIAPQLEITPEEIPAPSTKVTKPTSILSTADKNDAQKKKKRVNFIDSSETDESAAADKVAASTTKPAGGNTTASSESDFDFSSSIEADAKST